MNPGELKHKVSIYALQLVQNAFGGSSATEQLIVETWAKKEPVRSNNQLAIEAGASALNEDMVFTIRYRNGLNISKDAILKTSGGEKFTILSVTNLDDDNKYIRIVGARQK